MRLLSEHLSGKDSHFIHATNLPEWSAAHARLTDEQRKAQPGEWLVRSTDHGLSWSWSAPLIISGDAAGVDHGYPSTVELNDCCLLTLWYEKLNDTDNAVLRQARWTIQN